MIVYRGFYCTLLLLFVILVDATTEDNSVDAYREGQSVLSGKCKCQGYNCGCCEHVQVAHLHINSTVCTNVSYLPDDIGISITITYNSYTVFNETVSVRNPPPYCIGQPFVDYLKAEVCVRLYDIDAKPRGLHGCVRIEVELYKNTVAKYDLGCFDIGNTSSIENSESRSWMKNILGRIGVENQPPVVVMIR